MKRANLIKSQYKFLLFIFLNLWDGAGWKCLLKEKLKFYYETQEDEQESRILSPETHWETRNVNNWVQINKKKNIKQHKNTTKMATKLKFLHLPSKYFCRQVNVNQIDCRWWRRNTENQNPNSRIKLIVHCYDKKNFHSLYDTTSPLWFMLLSSNFRASRSRILGVLSENRILKFFLLF